MANQKDSECWSGLKAIDTRDTSRKTSNTVKDMRDMLRGIYIEVTLSWAKNKVMANTSGKMEAITRGPLLTVYAMDREFGTAR